MMYFDVDKVEAIFEAPECGILQWQVILGGADDGSPVATLEVRVLRGPLPCGDSDRGGAGRPTEGILERVARQ